MRRLAITVFLISVITSGFGQKINSGNYGEGLRLAFDSVTKKVTGYFENYTGWDESTNNHRFSCIFYVEGVLTGTKFNIDTYYPADKESDLIKGNIEIANSKKIEIKLPEEHGGCWNVQHFADEPAVFMLEQSQQWIQIRYVNVAKAFFYAAKSEANRLKAYIVKDDFVCVQKIEGEWAYCSYYGKRISKGWVKLTDLNILKN